MSDYPQEHLDRLAREAAALPPRPRRVVEALLARTPEVVKADEESGDWRVFAGRPFERTTRDLAEDFGLAEKTVRKHADDVPGYLVGGKSRTRGWRRVRLSTAAEMKLHDLAVAARERAERENAAAGTSGGYSENGVRANGATLVYRASFANLPADLAREFLSFVGEFEKKVAARPRRCPECGGALEVDPSDDEIRYCTECGEEVTR